VCSPRTVESLVDVRLVVSLFASSHSRCIMPNYARRLPFSSCPNSFSILLRSHEWRGANKKAASREMRAGEEFLFQRAQKILFFPSFSFLLSLPSSPSRARASQPLLKPSARSCHPHPPLCCLSLSQTHRGEEEKAVEHSPASPASRKIYLYTRRRGRKSFSRFFHFREKKARNKTKNRTREAKEHKT
jgi:hypothetical protein